MNLTPEMSKWIQSGRLRKAPPKMDGLEKYLAAYAMFNMPDDRIIVSNAASLSMLNLWQNKIEESKKWAQENGYFENGDGKETFEQAKEFMGDLIDSSEAFLCPSDLFIAGTIPLPSIEMIQLEPDKHELEKGARPIHLTQLTSRVFVFDDYKEEILRAQQGEAAMGKNAVVGFTEVDYRGTKSFNYILIDPDLGYTLADTKYPVIGIDPDRAGDNLNVIIEQQHSLAMMDWYSIQIAMLHPIVKDRFGTVKNHKERISKDIRKADPTLPEVKYIKYITLDSQEIEDSSYVYEKDKQGITRRTLIWHVTGHYRVRKGKREWVSPYFKGPARWMKQQETRDRNVVDKSMRPGEVYEQRNGDSCVVTYVMDDVAAVKFPDGTEAGSYIDEIKEGRLNRKA